MTIFKKIPFQIISITIILLLSCSGWAYFILPPNLDEEKSIKIVEKIGFSSSTKYLSHNYVLGGYEGFEFSTYFLQIPVSRINETNTTSINSENEASKETDKLLFNIGIGKGLYHNVDIYINFTPLIGQSEISSYGASLRYTFFKDLDIPLMSALFIHGNGTNFANQLGVSNVGIDIAINYFIDSHWGIYVGSGYTRATALFNNIVQNGASSANTESAISVDKFQTRIFSGLSYTLSNYSLTLYSEKYFEPSFAFKLSAFY